MKSHGRTLVKGAPPSGPDGGGGVDSFAEKDDGEQEALLTRGEVLALIRREVGRDVSGAGGDEDAVDEEGGRLEGVEEALVGLDKSPDDVGKGGDVTKDAGGAGAPKIGKLLPKDVYSFLAFAPMTSPAFFVALTCHLVQMFSLLVVTMDQFYAGNNTPDNLLGVPPYVNVPVRACQFFALVIAVVCEPDPLWSINLYFRGFDLGHFRHYFPDNLPKHLKWRWILSAFARLIEGLFCLATMFMLIMRSTTGKDVLLSFKAIIFISGLDNAVFGLSSWGYFGESVRKVAKHDVIGDVDFSQVAESKRKWCNMRLLRSLTVASIFVILVSFWAYITSKQMSGAYLPSSIYVQFGDEEVPALGLLSDVFDLEVSFSDVMWVARGNGLVNANTRFRYCLYERAWLLEANVDGSTGMYHSCDEFIIKSGSTRSFNVLSVAGSGWSIHPDSGHTGQVDTVNMVTRPSSICPPGSYGPKCEFSQPCEVLEVEETAFRSGGEFAIYGVSLEQDTLTENFVARVPVDGGNAEYSLVKNGSEPVLMYENPVYYSPVDLSGMSSNVVGTSAEFVAFELIVCVGRRWARAILGLSTQSDEDLPEKIKILEQSLKHVEHGSVSAFRHVTHLSEAFDIDTLGDSGMPTGLSFFPLSERVFKAAGNAAPVSLLCSCPICPMTAAVQEKAFTVAYPTSPFFGQNMTCADVLEMGSKNAKGSLQCNALMMESIFECGCPYQLPDSQACPLCPDGSQVDESFVVTVPFPGEGPYGGASCGELSFGINFPGGWSRGNDDYCPSFQMTYGSECGCTDIPPPPCEVACPVDGQVFDTQTVVPVFMPNDSWNGWHCGEIRGFLSSQKDEYCTEEMTTALADQCCV